LCSCSRPHAPGSVFRFTSSVSSSNNSNPTTTTNSRGARESAGAEDKNNSGGAGSTQPDVKNNDASARVFRIEGRCSAVERDAAELEAKFQADYPPVIDYEAYIYHHRSGVFESLYNHQ
jgi:hypothetical protein